MGELVRIFNKDVKQWWLPGHGSGMTNDIEAAWILPSAEAGSLCFGSLVLELQVVNPSTLTDKQFFNPDGTARSIIAKVCNDARNSDLRADNRLVLEALDKQFDILRAEAAMLREALAPINRWYDLTTRANEWAKTTNNPMKLAFDRVAADWDLTLGDIRQAAHALAASSGDWLERHDAEKASIIKCFHEEELAALREERDGLAAALKQAKYLFDRANFMADRANFLHCWFVLESTQAKIKSLSEPTAILAQRDTSIIGPYRLTEVALRAEIAGLKNQLTAPFAEGWKAGLLKAADIADMNDCGVLHSGDLRQMAEAPTHD